MSDHDNRAVWGDTYAGDRMRAKRVPDDNVLLSVDGADDVPLWTAKVMESSARGLCSILADLLGVELHAKGTAAKLQELATEPLPDDDCRVRELLQYADDAQYEADNGTLLRAPGDNRARAHNLREAARHIRELEARVQELEAQVAAFRAPAEAAGYTVSEDGKCWTGNGGGREFFQGPPIDITHGEDPGDYLERIRAGEELGTVDHLSAARDCINEPLVSNDEHNTMMAASALAHSTIAQTERMDRRNALLSENVELLREWLALHQRGQELAEQLATEEVPPHIRYGAEVLNAGGKWRCERSTVVAWGDTPAEACAAFDRLWLTGSAEEGDDQ